MKRFATVLALSATVVLSGCAGAPQPARGVQPSPTNPSSATLPVANVGGNWHFTEGVTVPGKPLLMLDGSIGQADAALSATLHIDGSNCFDRSATISLTGTMTANASSLTSAPINGQVVTFNGNFADSTFSGTYRINGGCAGGAQGKIMGVRISNIGNNLSGIFTNSAKKTFNVSGTIAESAAANPEGTFEITGTTAFDTPCFKAGTLLPGTFPSGSFILGTSVALQIETGNGILTFVGNLSQSGSGELNGTYTVSGGNCDDSGTAVLQVAGAWDY